MGGAAQPLGLPLHSYVLIESHLRLLVSRPPNPIWAS